jgi:transcriptional regulator with XRE-family HTH domain
MSTFHDLLERARRASKLSYAQLAQLSNTTERSIEQLFDGVRSSAVLVRSVVTHLGITKDDVLAIDDIGEAIVYLWCKEIGDHLLQKRTGVKTSALAEAINVNTSTIHRWERATARPTEANLRALVNAYDATLGDLLMLGLWPPVQHPGATLLGSVLLEHREALGMGQREFARFMDVNKDTYRAWETGSAQPNGERRSIVARVLGITVADVDALIVSRERVVESTSAFSQMLKQHRKQRGWTREDVAALACVPLSRVQTLEKVKGRPKVSTLLEAQAVFQLSREQLMPFAEVDPSASFGSWLRVMRISAGMSVYDVAAHNGPARNTVVFYESDRLRPSTATALKLADILDVPHVEILARLEAAGPVRSTPFAELCVRTRKSKNRSVADIARSLGVIPAKVQGVETARWTPSEAKLPTYAKAYGIPLVRLVEAHRETLAQRRVKN